MKVILTEDIPKLGNVGEVVDVADGYGRNFLLPKKKAVLANTKNMRRLEHDQKLIQDRLLRAKKDGESLAQTLTSISLTIAKPVGEEEKLFGSVTTRDIAEALAEEGFNIDRKTIELEEAIRSLGVYTVHVKVHPEVKAKLKIWVVAK